MITDQNIFDYVGEMVPKRMYSYRDRVDFPIADIPILTNKINLKIWQQRDRLDAKTYKNYINTSISNTVRNYFRDYFNKNRKEQSINLYTVLKEDGFFGEEIEVIPDIAENPKKYINVDFEEFSKELTLNETKYFNLLLEEMPPKDIASQLGVTPREVYKKRNKIHKKFKEFSNKEV